MAVGFTLTEVTVNAAGETRNGSVAIGAQGANTKITSVEPKTVPPEVRILGVDLSNSENAAGSLKYECRGKSGVNYPVVLELGVYSSA